MCCRMGGTWEEVFALGFLLGLFSWALAATFPTERSEACSQQGDEIRDCKLHKTQSKDCT